ncbi:MAG: type II toxin-antitoxin system RelE/ParE family toxin [Promethearchaeota archaeon]
MEKAIMKIRENPERYPRVELNIRKYVVQKFPFTIFYETHSFEILILAVGHQKRKPNYWQERV